MSIPPGKLLWRKILTHTTVIVKVNGQELKAQNVDYSNQHLTFKVYVESELVSLDILVEENTMTGTASYSEGDLELSATKE